ncbi:hypothetical protein U1Q18_039634, partial [Sarracenia purpurea var. burkii]
LPADEVEETLRRPLGPHPLLCYAAIDPQNNLLKKLCSPLLSIHRWAVRSILVVSKWRRRDESVLLRWGLCPGLGLLCSEPQIPDSLNCCSSTLEAKTAVRLNSAVGLPSRIRRIAGNSPTGLNISLLIGMGDPIDLCLSIIFLG